LCLCYAFHLLFHSLFNSPALQPVSARPSRSYSPAIAREAIGGARPYPPPPRPKVPHQLAPPARFFERWRGTTPPPPPPTPPPPLCAGSHPHALTRHKTAPAHALDLFHHPFGPGA
jgi:hypothetical protein